MTPEQLQRINQLARKKKTLGLTPKEEQEQKALRDLYLAQWREGVQRVLEHTYIQTPDGKKHKLEKKDSPYV